MNSELELPELYFLVDRYMAKPIEHRDWQYYSQNAVTPSFFRLEDQIYDLRKVRLNVHDWRNNQEWCIINSWGTLCPPQDQYMASPIGSVVRHAKETLDRLIKDDQQRFIIKGSIIVFQTQPTINRFVNDERSGVVACPYLIVPPEAYQRIE